MTRRRFSGLDPDADLVVVYFGTDPHYHQRDVDQPNRPACDPAREPGVLTKTKSAEENGLSPCPECRANDSKGTDRHQMKQHRISESGNETRADGRVRVDVEVNVEQQPAYPTSRNDLYTARVASAIKTNLEDLKDVISCTRSVSAAGERR